MVCCMILQCFIHITLQSQKLLFSLQPLRPQVGRVWVAKKSLTCLTWAQGEQSGGTLYLYFYVVVILYFTCCNSFIYILQYAYICGCRSCYNFRAMFWLHFSNKRWRFSRHADIAEYTSPHKRLGHRSRNVSRSQDTGALNTEILGTTIGQLYM